VAISIKVKIDRKKAKYAENKGLSTRTSFAGSSINTRKSGAMRKLIKIVSILTPIGKRRKKLSTVLTLSKLFRQCKNLKIKKVDKTSRQKIKRGYKGPRKANPIRLQSLIFFISLELNDSEVLILFIKPPDWLFSYTAKPFPAQNKNKLSYVSAPGTPTNV
jgi:hypothetical protein